MIGLYSEHLQYNNVTQFFLFRYPGHEHESLIPNAEERSLDWDYFLSELGKENGGMFSQNNSPYLIEDEMNKIKSTYELVLY